PPVVPPTTTSTLTFDVRSLGGPATRLGTDSAALPVLPQQPPQTITSANRDVIASSSNAPIAVDLEGGGPNPAVGLILPGGSEFRVESGGTNEFALDENLLPLMSVRRASDGQDATDKVRFPAAALLSFAEGGVWTVIATFLPEGTGGQTGPLPEDAAKQRSL